MSVVTHNDHIIAVAHGNPPTVFRYARRGGLRSLLTSFKEVGKFSVQLNGWITLRVKDSQITCCSDRDDTIVVYSVNGELLKTYGARGSGDAGRFDWPLICGDDDDGSVLIADHGNNRL